jgi:hypothetical protein
VILVYDSISLVLNLTFLRGQNWRKMGHRTQNYVRKFKRRMKNVNASNMWTKGTNYEVHKYINVVGLILCSLSNAIFALSTLLIPYSSLIWKRGVF